jgi:predicted O-linked N-acetylglucosamine transferase (SPINDLY family)
MKIGYVSGDFRRHSVANFLLPVFRNHDRSAFEIYCYSNNPRNDDVTERLTAVADHWRRITGLDDDAAAKMIAEDKIDILVDLSGHTDGNRLSLFTRRPAPTQVTWLGYPGSTGVEAIGFRLVDEVSDPAGDSDRHYCERLIRLDHGFLCYAPIDGATALVARAPGNGRIRFGSFNNPAKLSPATLDVWGKLLDTVDGAELVLKGRPFADPDVRRLLLRRFEDRGIAEQRVVLLDHIPSPAAHMAAYGEIDIGLDPFPYNGTTTTCEALWMGVPVITLLGDRHSGRVGASLLSQVGLEDLIASNEENYVRLAAELAADAPRRADLRATLRDRMAASPLCDEPGFTRRLEAAYLEMHSLNKK